MYRLQSEFLDLDPSAGGLDKFYLLFRFSMQFRWLVAKSRHGQGHPEGWRSIWTSGVLEFELFLENCDSLGERTGTDSEGAFDDARLASDVLREVEDRRLALA